LEFSLVGMCTDDFRKLKIPAALGYGSSEKTIGEVSIPPGSPLFYEVTQLQTYPTRYASYSIDQEVGKCVPGTCWAWVEGGCSECPAGKHQPLQGQKGCYDCQKGKASMDSAARCEVADLSALKPGWAAAPEKVDDDYYR
jgi:hypothetical protein